MSKVREIARELLGEEQARMMEPSEVYYALARRALSGTVKVEVVAETLPSAITDLISTIEQTELEDGVIQRLAYALAYRAYLGDADPSQNHTYLEHLAQLCREKPDQAS